MAQQYTKCLIRDAFIAMLNEKPLKKITVKDIGLLVKSIAMHSTTTIMMYTNF